LGTEPEKFIETAKVILGDSAYTADYEAGQQMNFDESIAYALKELQ